MTDAALDFWLRHVASEGGLHEPAGDATYVVLPPALSGRYGLPEELRVTADPDIARDDGVTLVTAGHPVLSDSAERIIASGDVGTFSPARPASVPPGPDVVLESLRDAVPVDHGKIDVEEPPQSVRHRVLRVGALVTFELSADDQFGEPAERWIDVPSHRELSPAISDRLSRAAADEDAAPGVADAVEVWPAVAEAHRLIDAAALTRREELAGQVNGAFQAERTRAANYYADAIAGIGKRLETAPGDRKAVLEQRLRSTREEQARRLAEIAEKYSASHAIRPYRLHVVDVPALRLSADVRRGNRRYPMAFDWLLPVGVFAPVRCPSCGGLAPLVAGKQNLGCEDCLLPRPAPAPEPSPPSATETPAKKKAPGDKPAAAASGKPPVPPRAKQSARPAAKRGRVNPEKLAERLWLALGRGTAGDASPVIAPGSPAEVLYEVLGPSGLTQALGFPPDVMPYRYSVGGYRLLASHNVLASGDVEGSDGSERAYFLGGQDGVIAEVLPCPVFTSGKLHHGYWRMSGSDPTRSVPRIPKDADIDPVGRILLGTGPRWNGLCVAARSVAAWERIADSHERVLNGRPPRAVAAAVDRLVAYRAGSRGTFADAAAVYRVAEKDIRTADRLIRPLLALDPSRPW